MKNNYLIYTSIGILILLIGTFFFEIIPIPVPNIDGKFGGFYFTSGLFNLQVHNYKCLFFYGLFFLTLFGGLFAIKMIDDETWRIFK